MVFGEGVIDFATEEVAAINQETQHNPRCKRPAGVLGGENGGDDSGNTQVFAATRFQYPDFHIHVALNQERQRQRHP